MGSSPAAAQEAARKVNDRSPYGVSSGSAAGPNGAVGRRPMRSGRDSAELGSVGLGKSDSDLD